MKVFPVPPVCTGNWTKKSWKKYEEMYSVETEPKTIRNSFGLWKKTDKRDEKGNALYTLVKKS